MLKIEKYNKDRDYSFTFGAFPTFELIKNKPKNVECLLLHSKLKQTEDILELIKLCKENNIPLIRIPYTHYKKITLT